MKCAHAQATAVSLEKPLVSVARSKEPEKPCSATGSCRARYAAQT
jgi:hypothetical protein